MKTPKKWTEILTTGNFFFSLTAFMVLSTFGHESRFYKNLLETFGCREKLPKFLVYQSTKYKNTKIMTNSDLYCY